MNENCIGDVMVSVRALSAVDLWYLLILC